MALTQEQINKLNAQKMQGLLTPNQVSAIERIWPINTEDDAKEALKYFNPNQIDKINSLLGISNSSNSSSEASVWQPGGNIPHNVNPYRIRGVNGSVKDVAVGSDSEIQNQGYGEYNAYENTGIKGLQTGQAKNYRGSEEERSSNFSNIRRLDPQVDYKHAEGNFRGNLNKRTYGQTLALSRAADVLNNKRHWNPGQTATNTAKLQGRQAVYGRGEKWDPVETQETRTMRGNEQVYAQQRQFDLQRENRARQYTQDVQEKIDNLVNSVEQQQIFTDINFSYAIRQAVLNANLNIPITTSIQQTISLFNSELNRQEQDIIYQAFLDAYHKQGPVGANIFGFMTSGKNPGLSIKEQYLNNVWQTALDANRDPNGVITADGYKEAYENYTFANVIYDVEQIKQTVGQLCEAYPDMANMIKQSIFGNMKALVSGTSDSAYSGMSDYH